MITRKKRNGFTLVELLIALAITAMLMASVAVAIQASWVNFQQNDNAAAGAQTARMVLGRMMNDIRTAEAIDEHAPAGTLTLIPPTNPQNITLIQYNKDRNALTYRQTIGTEVQHACLLIDPNEDVTLNAMNISYATGVDDANVTYTKSVAIELVVVSNNETYRYSASASPRRSLR